MSSTHLIPFTLPCKIRPRTPLASASSSSSPKSPAQRQGALKPGITGGFRLPCS